MTYERMTLEPIHDSLAALPPAGLLGVRLFQTHTPASLFPTGIAREQLVAAITELVDYGERCRAALGRLGHLTATPLLSLPVWEYGL